MSHPAQALFTAQFNNHLGIPVYIIRRDPPPFSLWGETVLKKGLIMTQLREEPPLTQYMASSPEDSREGLSPARRDWGPAVCGVRVSGTQGTGRARAGVLKI